MKKNMKLYSLMMIAVASLFFLSACNKEDDDMPQNQPEMKNIVQVASETQDFSILVEALQKAELVSALQADGPFTVFAPTNQAFNDLFSTLGVSGIADLSKETLTPILLYHVVGQEAMSGSLSTGYIPSLNTGAPGQNPVSIFTMVERGVMINGDINVTSADISASNGVIHVIDKVMLPPSIVELAISNKNFSTLVSAVVKAELVDALSSEGPFTVFAPTNEAFEMLFKDLGVTGINDLTKEQLTPILLYHVLGANVTSAEVSSGSVATLNSSNNITIKVDDMGVMLNGTSNVVAVDVQGVNGVIHAIDKVLLPTQ
jgi:transforming growth factor-beta-induced protein